jgi:hypothetical protein
VVAAKQIQERFRDEQRIDAADFQNALQRFQVNAHEVVTLVDQQLGELRSEENAELLSRLLANTHDVVDVLIGLVNVGAEVANQLVQNNLSKPTESSPRAKSRE